MKLFIAARQVLTLGVIASVQSALTADDNLGGGGLRNNKASSSAAQPRRLTDSRGNTLLTGSKECSFQDRDIILSQLPPQDCDNQPGNICSVAKETGCPLRTWLTEYYQQKMVLSAAAVADGEEDDSIFLGISVGCNRGIEAVEFLQLGTYNKGSFALDGWREALDQADMLPEGICGHTLAGRAASASISESEFGLDNNNGGPDGIASRGPREGHMHCIDPLPNTLQTLNVAKSLLTSDNEEIIQKSLIIEPTMAIGRKNGYAHFPIGAPAGSSEYNLLSCENQDVRQTLDCEDVPVFSLDSYAESHLQNYAPDQTIDVLHMSTVGFDYDVLQGGKYVLRRTAYLEFEHHKWGAWRHQSLREAIEMLDQELNFSCYWAGNGHLWRVSGPNCFLDYYDSRHISNLACVNRVLAPDLVDIMERRFQDTLQLKTHFKSARFTPDVGVDAVHPMTQASTTVVPAQPDTVAVDEMIQEILGPARERAGDSELEDPFAIDLINHMEACIPTTQVALDLTWCGHDHCPYMKMHSLDRQGHCKTQGGDEFYVTYFSSNNFSNQSPDAVGHVYSNNDGSYNVYFHDSTEWLMAKEWPGARAAGVPTYFLRNPPPSAGASSSTDDTDYMVKPGKIRVAFQYTCGLGSLFTPPSKNAWTTPGLIHRIHESELLRAELRPEMTALERPSPKFAQELSQYDVVFGVGDSLVRQVMEHAVEMGKYHMQIPRSNVKSALNTFTAKRRWKETVDFSIDKIMRNVHFINKDQNEDMPREQKQRWCLLMGSMAWDINADNMGQGMDFHDHQEAMEWIIGYVRNTYINTDKYPFTLDLYWKSATAQHVQYVEKIVDEIHGDGVTLEYPSRIKYASETRSRTVYNKQMEMFEKLNVPVLDVYNMTLGAVEWLRENDATHYTQEFNDFLGAMFFDDELIVA
jgi:hypothetical protein